MRYCLRELFLIVLCYIQAVAAIVVNFMPGQEVTRFAPPSLTHHHTSFQVGSAIADVLFGDVNPSAHLPITMPNGENDQKFTAAQCVLFFYCILFLRVVRRRLQFSPLVSGGLECLRQILTRLTGQPPCCEFHNSLVNDCSAVKACSLATAGW